MFNKSFNINIEGTNGVIPIKKCNLYLGNSGTCCRFLIPILAMQKGDIKYICCCVRKMQFYSVIR